LKKSLLKIPEDISRGDRVTILAENKTIRITVPGIAGENGRKGKTIKVKNIDSKKIIYARVLDSATVKVDF
jgi:flagella basal body P-ring formation protein FlgA|tara:strand:+ start:868 stop:1080 length:213 start_codon:yes stop_codon:yes gene_type:complete